MNEEVAIWKDEGENKTLEGQIVHLENVLIKNAINLDQFNDLLGFYFLYLSTYIPMLEFTVENLSEDEIAGLANFGMVIDYLMDIQISRLVDKNFDFTVKEISQKVKKPKTEIMKMMNDVTIAQKIQLSTTLISCSAPIAYKLGKLRLVN